jgi:RimJ/RimL family protein N-acetyltransferase
MFGEMKSGRIIGVVVLTRWSYGGIPLYFKNSIIGIRFAPPPPPKKYGSGYATALTKGRCV